MVIQGGAPGTGAATMVGQPAARHPSLTQNLTEIPQPRAAAVPMPAKPAVGAIYPSKFAPEGSRTNLIGFQESVPPAVYQSGNSTSGDAGKTATPTYTQEVSVMAVEPMRW